jgi:3-hydroxyisobutyrate dehydrogenase-like beta-hydroxyacid dehydrogenase
MTIENRDSTVGFIGLGMMGIHMATNIVRKGHPLVVCDVVPEKNSRLAKEGAKVASSPCEVARQARIVILMVDTTAQVETVLFGADGIASTAQPGDKVICMSTIDPALLRGFAQRLAQQGVGLIDSPVAGMEKGAREGTLRAYIGGDVADFEACRPVLEAMATTIVHIGPVGQGLVMKLINNMLCQAAWVLIAEGMVVGTKAGLDPKMMVDLIGNATGNSVAFQYMAPRWLARDFDGIRLDITNKDMQHEIDLGRSLGVPMPMATVAQQIYQMAHCQGYGNEDGVAVVKVYETLAGLTFDGKA